MASETTAPYDLVDLHAQIEQLRQFSQILGWTTAAFAMMALLAGWWWSDGPMAVVGVIVGAYSSTVWVAWYRLRYDQLPLAVALMSFGIVVGECVIAFVFPSLGPTLALASLMPLILAMHYGEAPWRRIILIATAVSSLSVILLWYFVSETKVIVPRGFVGFYQITSMVACLGLAARLCWPIREWLNERFVAAEDARKAAEEERARFEAFLRSQYDAVIATDEAGLVTVLNAAAEEATGWTFDEVKGRHIADSFCFETSDATMGAEDFVERALSTEKGFLELKGVKLIARNHDKVWKVTVSAAPVLVGTHRQGAIFTFRDLTKHLQSIERDQAAERMLVVERMAAGLAPEFGEACQSIKRLGQKIGGQVQMAELPEIGDVNELVRAGDKAAAMAGQLLAIGGRQPCKPITFEFGGFVSEILDVLQHTLGRDIRLVHQGAVSDIGSITADPAQLRDAIHQVANYARDTMPVGGTLCIEANNIFVPVGSVSDSQPDTGGAYVQLVIKDSGAGLNERDVQHILEPFYAPATRMGHRATHSALNLSIVHGLVRQNGGFLSVNSKLRVGSTYTMLFPRVDVDDWLVATGARQEGWKDAPFQPREWRPDGIRRVSHPPIVVQELRMPRGPNAH